MIRFRRCLGGLFLVAVMVGGTAQALAQDMAHPMAQDMAQDMAALKPPPYRPSQARPVLGTLDKVTPFIAPKKVFRPPPPGAHREIPKITVPKFVPISVFSSPVVPTPVVPTPVDPTPVVLKDLAALPPAVVPVTVLPPPKPKLRFKIEPVAPAPLKSPPVPSAKFAPDTKLISESIRTFFLKNIVKEDPIVSSLQPAAQPRTTPGPKRPRPKKVLGSLRPAGNVTDLMRAPDFPTLPRRLSKSRVDAISVEHEVSKQDCGSGQESQGSAHNTSSSLVMDLPLAGCDYK